MKTDARERARYAGLFLGLVVFPTAIPVYLYVLNACIGVELTGLVSLLYDAVIGNGISYVWVIALGWPYVLLLRRVGRLNLWTIVIPALAPAAISLILTCLLPEATLIYGLFSAAFIAPGILLAGPCLWLLGTYGRRPRGINTVIALTLLAWLAFFSYVSVQFHHWLFVAGRVPTPYGILSSFVRSWFAPSLIIGVALACVWGTLYFRDRNTSGPAQAEQ